MKHAQWVIFMIWNENSIPVTQNAKANKQINKISVQFIIIV